MVTIAKYGDVQEAVRLKMALEAQGISAFIPDENTAYNAPPQFLTSPSGIRVQVDEQDVEVARKVIESEAKNSRTVSDQ